MKNDPIYGKLKKYIYSGIGLASHSKEIIHNLVGDIAKQQRLSEADGSKIVDSAVKSMQKHLPDIEGKYRAALMKVLHLANSEVMMLQKKVTQLENKAGGGVKAAVKKAVPVKRAAVKKVVSRARRTAGK